MSKQTIRKQASYSEFRKKNTHRKISLENQQNDSQTSFSMIAEQKISQLSSIQQELFNLTRNRSLSSKQSNVKLPSQIENKSLIGKSVQNHNDNFWNVNKQLLKQNSQSSIQLNSQKATRSCTYQSLNHHFQIIEQSEIYNEEDNFCNDQSNVQKFNQKKYFNQKKNSLNQQNENKKVTSNLKDKDKILPVFSNIAQKRKTSIGIQGKYPAVSQQKLSIDVAISQLNDIHCKLDEVKRNNKNEIVKGKISKKVDPTAKPNDFVRQEKKIHRSASEAGLLSQKFTSLKRQQTKLKEKDNTPKILTKKKIIFSPQQNRSTSKFQTKLQKQQNIIPTKMISSQQKQKILKGIDQLKQIITCTQICVDNAERIRIMLKEMSGLIIN